MARVAGEILRAFGDSILIPFNVTEYAASLELFRQQLDHDFGQVLGQNLGTNYSKMQFYRQSVNCGSYNLYLCLSRFYSLYLAYYESEFDIS